jgi:hypothetical protein
MNDRVDCEKFLDKLRMCQLEEKQVASLEQFKYEKYLPSALLLLTRQMSPLEEIC